MLKRTHIIVLLALMALFYGGQPSSAADKLKDAPKAAAKDAPKQAAKEKDETKTPVKKDTAAADAPTEGGQEIADPAPQPATPQLPIPRFVTLGSDEVNMRTGPGQRYPIRLVVRKEGLPVEIIREFDVWRQIRDVDGDEGWVHKSMLSGRRAVIIKGQVRTLLKKPDENARPVVKLEPDVIANLDTCMDGWCRLKIASYDGWVKRDVLWGVYPDEKFKE